MTQLEAVARAVDFIEAKLQQPVSMADAAEAASYSLFHFCRTFSQVTHLTPYDYLIRRRLAEAARQLLGSQRKILDVALDYQFNNPETFSRAFRRLYQTQPNQFRTRGCPDPRSLMPRLSRDHLVQMQKNAACPPQIVERPAWQLGGRMTLVREGREGVTALWEIIVRERAFSRASADPQAFIGLAEFPPGWQNQGWFYSALFHEPSAGSNWPMRSWPAGRFVRFVHQGGMETLPLTLDAIYHTWQPLDRPLPETILEEYETFPPAAQKIILYLPLVTDDH